MNIKPSSKECGKSDKQYYDKFIIFEKKLCFCTLLTAYKIIPKKLSDVV